MMISRVRNLGVCGGGGERETQTDRQTDRQTDGERF